MDKKLPTTENPLRETGEIKTRSVRTAPPPPPPPLSAKSSPEVETKPVVEEVDYESLIKGMTYKEYCSFRFANSNILKYYTGKDITEEEADTVVNALSLVAALVLTIPFGAALSFDNSFWDWLHDNISTCGDMKDVNHLTFYDVYNLITQGLYAVAYSSSKYQLNC
jgi:hypothetical protein